MEFWGAFLSCNKPTSHFPGWLQVSILLLACKVSCMLRVQRSCLDQNNFLMKKNNVYLFQNQGFKTFLFSKPSWWNLLEESKKKYTSQNVFYKRFSLTRAMRRVSRVPSNQDQWCQPSTNSQHRGWKNLSKRIHPGLIHKNLHRATAMNLRQTRPRHNCCCCILVSKIVTMFHVQKGEKKLVPEINFFGGKF